MPTATGPLNIPVLTSPTGNRTTDKAALAANLQLYSPGTAQRVTPPRAIATTGSLPDVFTSKAEAAQIAKRYQSPEAKQASLVAGVNGTRVQANPTPGTVSYAGDGTKMPANVAPLVPPTVTAAPKTTTPAPANVTAGPTGSAGKPGTKGAPVAAPSEPVTANAVGRTVAAMPGAVVDALGEAGTAAAGKVKAAGAAIDKTGSSFVAGLQGKTAEEWAQENADNARQHAAFQAKQDAFASTIKKPPVSPLAPGLATGPMSMSTMTGVIPRPPVQTIPTAPNLAPGAIAPDNTGTGLLANPLKSAPQREAEAKRPVPPQGVTPPTMADAFTPRSAAPVAQPSLPQLEQQGHTPVPPQNVQTPTMADAFPPRSAAPTPPPAPAPVAAPAPPPVQVNIHPPTPQDAFTPRNPVSTGAAALSANGEDDPRKRVASGYPAMQ